MTRKYLSYLFAALMAVSLGGCKAELGELDTTAGLNTALSMPVGSFTISMNDLLGKDAPNLIVDENGLFHIMDTTIVNPKSFHAIDLTDYFILTEGGKHFNVYEQISEKINPEWMSLANIIVSPIDTIIPLTFDMSMKLKGFNEDMDSERVDSIWVALAEFVSTVNHSADFGITWNNISAVTLKMGDRVVRHNMATNDVNIPLSTYNFGDSIPIIIDDFSVNLVDNESPDPLGLVDSVSLQVQFDLALYAGEIVSITSESEFVYDLKIDLLTYDAVWGFFKESREMFDHNAISMDSLWRNWSEVQQMKLKFAQPSLSFFLTHHVAAPLKTHIDYMYSYNKDLDVRTYATWNNKDTVNISVNPVLDPLVSHDLNDSVEIELRFSYRDDEGDIGKLFYNLPDSFCYAYHVMVDESRRARYPQHRLTSNMDFRAKEVLDLPFYFEDGTSFTCTQEMEGLKLSTLQLDSMLEGTDLTINTTRNDLTLYLAAENYVPFEVDLVMECLDKNGVPVDISFFEGDTLRIPHPAAADIVDGTAVRPSQTISTHVLHKQQFNDMSKVDRVRLLAIIGKNDSPAKLTTTTKLTVKIGITAEVEGTINFDKLFKK